MRVFETSTAMDDIEHIFCCKCLNVLPDYIIFPCGHYLCQKCKDITSCLTCGRLVCLIKDSFSLDCYRILVSRGLHTPTSKGPRTPKASSIQTSAKKVVAKSHAVLNTYLPLKQEKLLKKSLCAKDNFHTPKAVRSSARLSSKKLTCEYASDSKSSKRKMQTKKDSELEEPGKVAETPIKKNSERENVGKVAKTPTKKNSEVENSGKLTETCTKKIPELKNCGKMAEIPKKRRITRNSCTENAESDVPGMSPVEATLEGQAGRHVHAKKARLLKNLSASKPRPSPVGKANLKIDDIVRTGSPPSKKRKVSRATQILQTRASLRSGKLFTDSSDEGDGVFVDSDSTVCCGETYEVVAQVHADPYMSSSASFDDSQADAIGYTQVGLGHLDRHEEDDAGVSTLITPVESAVVAPSSSQASSSKASASLLAEVPLVSLTETPHSSEAQSRYPTENCKSELHLRALNCGSDSSLDLSGFERSIAGMRMNLRSDEFEDHRCFTVENDENRVNLSSFESPAEGSIIKSSVPPEEEYLQGQILKTPNVREAVRRSHSKLVETDRVIKSLATTNHIETIISRTHESLVFPNDDAPDSTIPGNTEPMVIDMELDTSRCDVADDEYDDPLKKNDDGSSKSPWEGVYSSTAETPKHGNVLSGNSVCEDFFTPSHSSDYLESCSKAATTTNLTESHNHHPVNDQMPCYSNDDPPAVVQKTLEQPEILLVNEHQSDSLPVMHQGPVNAITSFTPPSSMILRSYDIGSNLSSQTSLLDLCETRWSPAHRLLSDVFSKIYQPGKPKSLVRMAFDVLLLPLKNKDVFHGLSTISPITESAEKSVQVELFLEQSTVKVDLGKDPQKRNSITRRQLSFVSGDTTPFKKPKSSPEHVDAEESEDIVEGTPTKDQLVRVNLLNDSPLSRTLVPEDSPAQIPIKSAVKEASRYSIFDPLPNEVEANETKFLQSQSNCQDTSLKPSIPKISELVSPLKKSPKNGRPTPQIENQPPRQNCNRLLSSTPISQTMDTSLPVTDSESIISDSEQLPYKRKHRLALPLGGTCNQNPKQEKEQLSYSPIALRNSTRFKVTTTGIYDNVEKNAIKKLCVLMKATFSTELTRETTHLILPDGDDVMLTTKYMMALYNGSYILPMRWVFDCLISKCILPEVNYFFKHSGIHRRMMNQHKPMLFGKFLFYISPEVRKDEVNYKALKDLMSFCECNITDDLDEVCRAASQNMCNAVVLRGEDYIPSQNMKGGNSIIQVSYKWFYACLTSYDIQPFNEPSFF